MIKQQTLQSQKSRNTTLFGNRPSMKKGNKNCTPAIGLNGVANKTFQERYSGYRPLRSNTQYLNKNFSLRLSALWRKQFAFNTLLAIGLQVHKSNNRKEWLLAFVFLQQTLRKWLSALTEKLTYMKTPSEK